MKKYADEVICMKRQLPKNVRQIGNVSDNSKIYIEDYVDTFFNQLCEKTDQTIKGAFLIGEIVREENEEYIYVYGAVQMKEVLHKGKEIYVNDSTWKKGCEMCKEYFGGAEILGWFLAAPGQAIEINHNIMKVHQKLFPREKSIFVVKEAREKDEKYYVYKYKELMESAGHYIYYEKNAEMQNYMISLRKKTGMTPSEIIEDTVTKNFRNAIQNKVQKKGTKGKKTHSRFMYALSTFLVLVVLITGVTMMNNYDKMKGMQNSLEELNEDVMNKEEAVETIGSIVQKEDVKESVSEENNKDGQKQEETSEIKEEDEEEEADKPETAENKNKNEVYTVQKGDTLASISKKVYGDTTRVAEICKINGLEDGNLILVGQKLLLP